MTKGSIAVFLFAVSFTGGAAFAQSAMSPRAAGVKENRAFVYHGKLVRPDGTTPNGSVQVTLRILSPDPKLCLLWAETQTVSLTQGGFSIELGHGVNRISGVTGGAASDFKQAFVNNAGLTISGALCAAGNSYTPTSADDRLLSASFNDGGEVVEIAGLPIKSVPFALQAEEIGGYGLSNLVKISGAGSAVVFAPIEIGELKAMADTSLPFDMKARKVKNVGVPVDPTDATTKTYVDSAITSALGSAGAGTVTNVSVAGGGLSVANGSSTPTITLPQASATTAGYLSSSDWNTFNGKQPAGSYLTSITSGNVTTALGFTPLAQTLATNQVFVGNGSSVATAQYFGLGQLRSTATGNPQFPASCGAHQTLVWSAITDVLACSNINNLDGDKITAGTVATARLGSGTADATKYLRGDGTWQTLPAGADQLGNHTATQNLNLASYQLVGNGGSNGIAITSGGNVGIGTTTASEKLEVVGGKIKSPEYCIGAACITAWPATGGGGTVTSVAVGGLPLSVTNGSTTPTVSIAQANTTTAGYLSAADWNTFNGKQPAGAYLTSITSGQVTTALGFTPIGQALPPNQVLIGSGASIATASYFGLGQLRSTTTGNAQFPSSCGAHQTMVWSAITDVLACSNISGLDADKTTSGVFTTARLGSGTADNTKYLRGDGTWQTLPAGSDNLGNHTATQNLNLASYQLVGNGGSSGLAITSAGNVGVGTSSPITRLHVGKISGVATSSVGDHVNGATDNQSGINQTVYSDGNNYIDYKTFTGGFTYFRTGQGTESGAQRIWMSVLAGNGNVGIGTASPAATLDVNGAVKSTATSNAGTTIDFVTGNFQYTSANCGALTLNNLKSGSSYVLAVQGASAGTCSFTAYSGSGTGALTVKNGAFSLAKSASKDIVFSIMVLGTIAYVTSADGF